MEYLRTLADSLEQRSVQNVCLALDQLPALFTSMPGWLRFKQLAQTPEGTEKQWPYEIRVYSHKRRVLALVAQHGWRIHGQSFKDKLNLFI